MQLLLQLLPDLFLNFADVLSRSEDVHVILVLSSAAICRFLFEYAKSRFSSNKAYITVLTWISITMEIIYDC